MKIKKKNGWEEPLTPFDPFRDIEKFFTEEGWKPFLKMSFPKVDISETEKEIKIVANVPGIDPDNIEIDVNENKISISGKSEKEEEKKDEKYYKYERESGEFKRIFTLPSKIDPDNVSATTKNGVLIIILPKIEEEKKKIKIKPE